MLSLRVTGIKKARVQLRYANKILIETIIEVLEEIADFLINRAKMNTPILTGYLRSQFKYEIEKRPLKLIIKNDAPYALKLHEEEWKLGKISRRMNRATVEGGIGNRFISRPVEYWRKQIDKKLQSIPERFIKKLKKKK